MKKRDLLIAGLLFAVPAFAQDGPTFDETRDAKVIFTQDFESDWDEWSNEVVDQIDGVWYYDVNETQRNGNFANEQIWKADSLWGKKIFRADTLIDLTNGVKVTDNAGEIAANNWPGESYTIATDDTPERHDAFDAFGEADKGGEKVFKYTSDTCTLAAQSWGTYKGGYCANYRRNLFVRGLPIEPESSYRLTFYLKTKVLPGHEVAPRMSAGIFRGYFASEKAFSNGLEDDADHYKYKVQIEYEKTSFEEEDVWEKVTYMTYYLNDSIANNFVFVDGYWWADEWRWNQVVGENDTIKRDYIVQPDKFFVRLGFVSDYTEFQLDNLSLTKSWIGGAEYFGDKLRIDFGYKTNLADLAKAAKAKTNIAAAEVDVNVPDEKKAELGYDYRFEVWGQNEDDSWEEVYIRSAEFHDDGYMYMFTEFYDDDNAYQFDQYKKVLVTFHNPVDDPELTLKYTGDGKSVAELFPKALDTTWIKNGKIVPDFYNEIATPNPYVFNGVHSLKDLPPVLQDAEIPNGSIFLDPVQSFSFKFSREVLIDDAMEASEKAIGYVNGVVWVPSFDAETNTLTITCPDDSWKTMSGDYEVKLIQLYGKGTDKGANVSYSYNFGAPSRTVSAEATPIDISWTLVGEHTSVAKGVYTWSAGHKTVGAGTAISTGNLNRLFLHNVEGSGIQAGYEVRPHGGGDGGHVYLGAGDPDYKIHLNPGGYKFKFKGTGWSWNNADIKPATVYVFKRADDPTKVSSSDKMEIGVYEATTKTGDGDLQNVEYAIPVENVDEIEYSFSISEADDYIIEFNNKAGAWSQGVFVGDFELGSVPSTVLYVNNLNEALTKAQDRADLAGVDPDLYYGTILTALNEKIEYYKIGGEFDALLATSPEAWNAAAKDLEDATNVMKLRMDTVDKFVETREKVLGKLADNESYEGLAVYSALNELYLNEAAEYPVTEKTGPEIYAFNKEMEDAITALDNRLAINKSLESALTVAKRLIDSQEKPDYAEYTDLESCYDIYNADAFNAIDAQDAEVTDATAAVTAASNAYKSRVAGAKVLPTRVNALYALAKELDSDIALNGVLTERLEATEFDDDELADIYKTAIKIALYDKADGGDASVDSIDITPFIKNYHLYQTAKIVERTGLQANSSNAHKADEGGANIQHVQHQWNSGDLNGKMPIWVMIQGPEYTDLYPGWTAIAYEQGNQMVTGDKDYTNYKNGITIFDAVVGMDWNGKAELKQELVDLPVGQYTLGVELVEYTNKSNQKASLTVTTLDSTYSKVADNTGAQIFGIDSILVAENDTVAIDFILQSGDGWSRADNFFLSFRPVDGIDYAELADAAENKLNELMTIVDARKAVQAGVEYYTVGGIKLDAPKAGQILIRKTTQSNGKVVMDKVLIK